MWRSSRYWVVAFLTEERRVKPSLSLSPWFHTYPIFHVSPTGTNYLARIKSSEKPTTKCASLTHAPTLSHADDTTRLALLQLILDTTFAFDNWIRAKWNCICTCALLIRERERKNRAATKVPLLAPPTRPTLDTYVCVCVCTRVYKILFYKFYIHARLCIYNTYKMRSSSSDSLIFWIWFLGLLTRYPRVGYKEHERVRFATWVTHNYVIPLTHATTWQISRFHLSRFISYRFFFFFSK